MTVILMAGHAERGDRVFVSVVTRSHLADARTLAVSVSRHHPDAQHWIFVVDAVDDGDLPRALHGERYLSGVELLARPQLALLGFAYLPVELCCALKPLALLHALRAGARVAIYLDCDMTLHGMLPDECYPTEDLPVALTPQVIGGYGPDLAWRYFSHQVGHFNAGFVAVRNSAVAIDFCEAWWSLCRLHCVEPRNREATFLDQGWLTVCSLQFPGKIRQVESEAVNIAPWNAELRPGVAKPILVHWSGEVMGSIRRGGRPEVPPQLGAALEQLQALHAESRVALADHAKPYRFSVFSDGSPIPGGARRWVLSRLRLDEPLGYDPFAQRRKVIRSARIWHLKQLPGLIRDRLGWFKRDLASLF